MDHNHHNRRTTITNTTTTSRFIISAVALLSLISLYISPATASLGSELPEHITNEGPFHLTWRNSNQSTRWDFVFGPKNITADIAQLETLTASNSTTLARCPGVKGCLFRDGELFRVYNNSSFSTDKFIFSSPVKNVDAKPPCENSTIRIHNYCSTHWNPPVHITGDDCLHTIDWHSPFACTANQTNYERLCYVHDPSGKLIDLTHLVLSNGSSYEIDTGNFSATIKKFHLNVCNEASKACGPNASSCRSDAKNGLIETGFNNLTSIQYNTTEAAVRLVSLGEYNDKCSDKRVKTIVKFRCPKQYNATSKPQLIEASECDNIIDWPTVRACPVPDIQADVTSCAIKYEPLGVDIDLRQVFGNQSFVEVPDVIVDGKNKTMMLGLCQGIKPSVFRCANKSSSTTTACLRDGGERKSADAKSSQVVGSITKSKIKLADTHLFLESFAINKTCEVPVTSGFNYTRQVGTRLEIVCSDTDALLPRFVTFEDCVYVFQWGSTKLCPENMIEQAPISNKPSSTPKPIITPSPSVSPSPAVPVAHTNTTQDNTPQAIPKSPEADEEANKTAHEKHEDTMADSKDMLKPDDHKQPEHTPTPKPTIINTDPKKETINGQTGQPINKMPKAHKFFMIGLIVMSLTAFVVVIFILDRKTNFKIPLGRIGRRARQALRPQPMPYTRVSFNDNLDL